MTVFTFPPADSELYPTLGPYVCQFIEDNFVHGPGDLLGEPMELDEEVRAWIYRMYEVEPPYFITRKGTKSKRRNPRAGRRRFERCVLSLRKGSNKTELAAVIAGCELHWSAPVRCGGFLKNGEIDPDLVHGVTDPYIPMISFTEEQTEELAYGALRRILQECALGRDFDIGLQRILRRDGNGKAEAVSASPNARDGARTTFQHADETHRFTLDHLRRAWGVMLANLAKRPLADPWALETTTAPEPGAGSVAESTMDFAIKLAEENRNPQHAKLFFFHREAASTHNLEARRGLREAIIEASGPWVAKWSDIDRIVNRFYDEDVDRAYLERVWLNRRVQASVKAFDVTRWATLKREVAVPHRAPITIGFDGSRYDDATGLVATHLLTGHQWVLGLWERPATLEEWEVAVEEVDGIVSDAFSRWNVIRMYCDPPKWESWVATWAGRYGDKVVVEWWTNRRRAMAYAIRSYLGALKAGELSHDGNPALARHLGNSCRSYTSLVDEEGSPLWILRKERPESPHKIDLAMAAVLSWEARNDAIAAGKHKGPSVYETRGPVVIGA